MKWKLFSIGVYTSFLFLIGCGNGETQQISDAQQHTKEAKEKSKEQGVHSNFVLNESCKSCHENIYEEYSSSMHANASIFKDPVHKAIWDKHPKNKKMQQYVCAKCHTPAANNFKDLVTEGKHQVPDANNLTHLEGVACAYCHRIEAIKPGEKTNTNVIASKRKEYFGNIKEHAEAGFHTIKTNNELFLNGNVCIGCHSHKQNKHGLSVCTTEINNTENENCITCHMPETDDSVAVGNKRTKHHFHGFAGMHNNQELLGEYIDIVAEKKDNQIVVTVTNNASHALLLHPLRLGLLKVSVTSTDGTTKELEPVKFMRVLGKDGKPAPPWVADTELKNTVLQGKASKTFTFDAELSTDDKIDITLGYFLVNPKMLDKLGLQDNDEIKQFHVLKSISI